MQGHGIHAYTLYIFAQTSRTHTQKKSSVSLVFGSGCAVTDEVSVSVKVSPHTPTAAQTLKFLQANEIEGRRNFVSLLFLGGGER